MNEQEIITRVKEDIHAAENVQLIESQENGRLYERYRGKTMGNEVKGRSQIVSTDIYEAVEWALPSLMDIFDLNNGIPEIEPQGPEDEVAAKKMTQLVRYQFWRQNDGETILRQAIKDALLYRPGGIIKYCWEKEVSKQPKSYEGLLGHELEGLMARKDVSVTGITDNGGNFDVETEYKITEFDGPRIYNVPPWEFLRHPNARNVKDSPFVAHKKQVTIDHLRRKAKAGYYKNVEKGIDEAQNPEGTDYAENKVYVQDGYSRDEEKSGDKARKEVTLYECYVRIDVDGDGLLENRIISVVGNTIIRDEENVYRYPPFVVLRTIEDTHKFSGITQAEMMEDLQKLNTFLLRQTVDNIAQGNNSRKIYDPTRISHADLMLNVPGAPIRTTKPGVDVRTALMELPTQVSHPLVLQFFGLSKEMGEQRSGISKSFRGVGDRTNETASGQFQAVNQASQRIRMVAKIIGTSLSDLFRAFIFMNKTMLTSDVAVRLDGEPLIISPDDLEGKMDLVLDVFLGASTRQQKVVNIQQLLAIFGQLMQIGMPVMDAANTATIVRELVKAMEFKAGDRFLPIMFRGDPKAANERLAQLQTQNMMMQGGKNGSGGGGATIGSVGGAGQGGVATTNPSGAGSPTSAMQPGSGSMVPGFV